ncbi:hypothetical protein OUZ56_008117 [Daphnia magna]|uniref:Uncharacterized protein n=1 Tax=Daphnia magna TaxID=35525 RepID=A0ABR0ACC9_9CRUS|nr:hypothetical protein OUZ56_008117 [Daphnia magna]
MRLFELKAKHDNVALPFFLAIAYLMLKAWTLGVQKCITTVAIVGALLRDDGQRHYRLKLELHDGTTSLSPSWLTDSISLFRYKVAVDKLQTLINL